MLSPSLYDRDAYQAQLRRHPEQRSGLRFGVLWRGRAEGGTTLKLRAELRGMAKGDLPSQMKLETEVKIGASGSTSRWAKLTLAGDDYKKFGEVSAWRVTLWNGDQFVAEQNSFLWQPRLSPRANVGVDFCRRLRAVTRRRAARQGAFGIPNRRHLRR